MGFCLCEFYLPVVTILDWKGKLKNINVYLKITIISSLRINIYENNYNPKPKF